MQGELIFVYGTLRHGCSTGAHNTYLAGARFVACAKVQGKLFRVSYYPALVTDDSANWVVGEVYELASAAQLDRLDNYEECSFPPLPHQEYQRKQVTVQTGGGDYLWVWVYAYQHASDDLQFIASGDFLNPW